MHKYHRQALKILNGQYRQKREKLFTVIVCGFLMQNAKIDNVAFSTFKETSHLI